MGLLGFLWGTQLPYGAPDPHIVSPTVLWGSWASYWEPLYRMGLLGLILEPLCHTGLLGLLLGTPLPYGAAGPHMGNPSAIRGFWASYCEPHCDMGLLGLILGAPL